MNSKRIGGILLTLTLVLGTTTIVSASTADYTNFNLYLPKNGGIDSTASVVKKVKSGSAHVCVERIVTTAPNSQYIYARVRNMKDQKVTIAAAYRLNERGGKNMAYSSKSGKVNKKYYLRMQTQDECPRTVSVYGNWRP